MHYQRADHDTVGVGLDPRQRPQHTLQRKLVLWTIVMVVTSTLLCAIWLTEIARDAMSRSHARNVGILNHTVAAALAGRIASGWNPDTDDVLRVLALDSRLAFLVLTDPEGELLYRHLIDPVGWSTYEHHIERTKTDGVDTVDRPTVLGEHGDLIVHKVPIWDPPLKGSHLNGKSGFDRVLEGFVVLAVREPALPETLTKLRAMQLFASGVVCVFSFPVVMWVVRRWTAPIRLLVEATTRLGAGGQPLPVTAETRDEMELLAGSFNTMARNLSATRYQLEKANEELEKKVNDRTAELERVNRKLKLELHDKNDFLRAVSHDLRAPLRNIDGMATMLRKKYKAKLNDEMVEKLNRISANVKVQADLINDLMELSRIRNRPGKRVMIDLNDLLEQVRNHLSFDLEQSEIVFEVTQQFPTIFANPNRIRQVFQNLLDNAIQYMVPRSPSRVTIEYCQDDEWHHFRVVDNGRGIAFEEQDHVFQAFRRITRVSGQDVSPGRGIGLATVKSIVESYGGSVEVHSVPGRGSTFHFTLDRRVVDVSRPALARSA